jgi:hypothetical protein
VVRAPPPLELLGQPYRAIKSANLRAAPSSNADRVGALSAGEEFTAVGRTEGAPWLLVGKGRRSVGYVHEPLTRPGPAQASGGGLRGPVNLDEIELGDDVVAEKAVAKTKCRGIKVVVNDKEGKQASDSKTACKSADGAWEMPRS